jgi:formylglycine-generating enzyme required for sulfatase activity
VDPECYPDEYPYHQVTLTAFRIDRTEVTVSAYADCHDSGSCSAPDTSGMSGRCNWDKPERVDHPINCVTWEQARVYCAWVGKRLPTEAEWEMAARGGDGRRYPWGNEVPLCSRANYGRCVGDVTEPVGSHPTGASASGALDMAGNVDEWVADWYDMDYYASSPATDPQGSATGEFRVVRGGSWFNIPWYLRTSARTRNDPSTRYLGTGFRCAHSLE